MSEIKDGPFCDFLGHSSQKKKASSSSSDSKRLSKVDGSSEGDVVTKPKRPLQPLSYLASSFRRTTSNQTLEDDQREASDSSSDSSLKRRYKWIMKFNCAKLNPSKGESSRKVKSKPCVCTHHKMEDGVEDIENASSSDTTDVKTSEFQSTISDLKRSKELLDEAAPFNNNEPATTSDSDDVKLGDPDPPQPIEPSAGPSNDVLLNFRLDIRSTDRARSSESIFTDNEKWVQIICPVDQPEYLYGDEDAEDVREVVQIASLANDNNSNNNPNDRKCLQVYYSADLNVESLRALFQSHFLMDAPKCHTQVDYIHYLVPDLRQITLCSFYWGKMDRYEAERLLDGKPEGTFLLRDSAQEDFLFSVSFRKYSRSLHARIEQWNHKFSFDSHDPCVYASDTVCGLIEHYKDPSGCMFFEPTLTLPLHRNFSFSLQHLCRSMITSRIQYDTVDQLELPKVLKVYLKEYHYRQQVRLKRFDTGEVQYVEYN